MKKINRPNHRTTIQQLQFAYYKDKVIDLLKRGCTVSVETMKVVREIENFKMFKTSLR